MSDSSTFCDLNSRERFLQERRKYEEMINQACNANVRVMIFRSDQNRSNQWDFTAFKEESTDQKTEPKYLEAPNIFHFEEVH